MRVDPNLVIFLGHPEWYTFEVGIGYVPTDEAPPEAVKAIEDYNSYGFAKESLGIYAEEWREVFRAEVESLQDTYTRMRQEVPCESEKAVETGVS